MRNDDSNLSNYERFHRFKKMEDNELMKWVNDEISFWKIIKTHMNPRDLEHDKLITEYLSKLEEYHELFGNFDEIEAFHTDNPLPFHDDTPISLKLNQLAQNGQLTLAICSFQMHLDRSSQTYTKSYESQLKKLEEYFNDNITAEKNNYIRDIDERLTTLNDSIENKQKSTLEELKDNLNASKKEIFNTVATANSEIFSAEPVHYWLERETNHKNKAKTYLKLIVTASILFTAALIFITMSVYKDGEAFVIAGIPITLPAEKFSIALLIIATTAAIWLIRVLVKLMMTNLALEIEALERSTMIKTFIAMDRAKAEQADEIRMLFYSTLFKPSSNSLTDDSTSPEYIRLIEAMLQKKT